MRRFSVTIVMKISPPPLLWTRLGRCVSVYRSCGNNSFLYVTGQNFFFGSDNRQPARFVPFTGSQQFVNYFPQTNAGPFLPFRAADLRASSAAADSSGVPSQKFQRQQFSSPAFTDTSDPRFDSLISPGTFTSNSEDYPEGNFHDATQDVQSQSQSRFKFNEPNSPENRQAIQFRNQLARFPPVAISEVTRSQDSPNSPNLIQTHSFNVHHTTRHPEELPLAQNNRWSRPTSQESDFNFRARNVPLQHFTSPKPLTEATEDAFKFSRFAPKEQSFLPTVEVELESSPDHFEHEPTPQVIRHDSYFPQDKKKDNKPKSNRVKTNSNIQPTTYSPPVLIDNRIRNTPSTTQSTTTEPPTTRAQIPASHGQVRGRNKFSRPPNEVEKTTKSNKIKTTIQTRSPSSTTVSAEVEEENDEFEIVTMSQDHLFVSEDNFKGRFGLYIFSAKNYNFYLTKAEKVFREV